MRTLHLLRHAKSDWADAGLADIDRPLNVRGRRAAARLAEYIAESGPHPQLVLCSPALRTRQTLDLVAPGLGLGARVLVEDELYGASAQRLWRRLRELPDAVDEVLLLGHNPGLHELAVGLADAGDTDDDDARDRLRQKLPTGALVTLAWPDDSWTRLRRSGAVLHNFVRPKDLG